MGIYAPHRHHAPQQHHLAVAAAFVSGPDELGSVRSDGERHRVVVARIAVEDHADGHGAILTPLSHRYRENPPSVGQRRRWEG